MTEQHSTAVTQVLASRDLTSVQLTELLEALQISTQVVPTGVDLPAEVLLTENVLADLEILPKDFGSVLPTDRRKLTDDEVRDLFIERERIARIMKTLESRKDAIAVAVKNHCDIEIEEASKTEGLPRDIRGHYLVPSDIKIPKLGKRFTREVRKGAPTVNVEDLERLAKESAIPGFDHEDYLACTTAVRVIDEAKSTVHFRKNPAVLDAFAAAMVPGNTTAAVYQRNLQ